MAENSFEAIKAGANAVLWEPHGFKWDSAWGAESPCRG